jgi:hypothetical protein
MHTVREQGWFLHCDNVPVHTVWEQGWFLHCDSVPVRTVQEQGWFLHCDNVPVHTVQEQGWFLHCDNVPVHTVPFIQKFPLKIETPVLPQQARASLSLANFFQFPELKVALKGHLFE